MASQLLYRPTTALLVRAPCRKYAPVLATTLQTRSFSTPSPMDGETELTPWQKVRRWLQPFATGTKAMYLENKQAWHIRKRLKAAEEAGDATPTETKLTRQEMIILRRAHRDLLKSLPLMALFTVPLLGYIAPIIGYQFPKQLLPWQFWRPDQKTQFFREDALARAAYYPKLLTFLERIEEPQVAGDSGPGSSSSGETESLKQMLRDNSDGADGLTPAQVAELTPFFDEIGPASLTKLNWQHISTLTESFAVFPAFSFVANFFPRSVLLNHLEKQGQQLAVDDQMLLQEGIESLSLNELEFACAERGIVYGYGDMEALRSALNQWLEMYDRSQLGSASPRALPSSLLLHAPALSLFSAPSTPRPEVEPLEVEQLEQEKTSISG